MPAVLLFVATLVVIITVVIAWTIVRLITRKKEKANGHTRQSDEIYRVVRVQGESKYRAAKVHSAHVKHQKEE